ncbi:Hypothetical protein CINCED_3A023935 [Cinara cedri]|uniref:Counting factor associated protein D n=1 Tax=Cinara cedri TaxID=506608 RepID=A0A5E4LYX8_9HEMI|nr:Hypothetical protein CINCED_3A023935 [Cinara cedri]
MVDSMCFLKQFLVLVLLNSAYCVVSSSNKSTVQWSSNYYIEGDIFVPFAEVHEPFKSWYDLESGSSRIDYYNGMDKTYQLSKKGTFGASIKIVPVTTETETNTIKCLEVNGTDELHILPQPTLPDLSNFKFIGEHLENNLVVEKWVSISRDGETVSKYTMWLYKHNNVNYPLRYQMNGYNSLLGSHFDSYIIMYKSFIPSKPDPSIFNIDGLKCESFPGPGIDYVYSFNPMMEFINNYEDHVDSNFEKFKKHHKKNYINKSEHFVRKNNFRQNLRYIHSKNRKNNGFTLSVNHLVDLSNEELKSMCGYRKINNDFNGGQPFPYNKSDFTNLPSEIDWRIAGAVTAVKDQSICGSCWSFGTTGTIEGAYFLKHGERKSFSEQALVDCSWGFGNNGCDGGEDFRAYSWIEKHGLPEEDNYGSYLSQDGYCHIANISNSYLTKISGFVNVTPFDEEALKIALVKQGPISIAIYASLKSLTFYSNGVYYDKDCRKSSEKKIHFIIKL